MHEYQLTYADPAEIARALVLSRLIDPRTEHHLMSMQAGSGMHLGICVSADLVDTIRFISKPVEVCYGLSWSIMGSRPSGHTLDAKKTLDITSTAGRFNTEACLMSTKLIPSVFTALAAINYRQSVAKQYMKWMCEALDASYLAWGAFEEWKHDVHRAEIQKAIDDCQAVIDDGTIGTFDHRLELMMEFVTYLEYAPKTKQNWTRNLRSFGIALPKGNNAERAALTAFYPHTALEIDKPRALFVMPRGYGHGSNEVNYTHPCTLQPKDSLPFPVKNDSVHTDTFNRHEIMKAEAAAGTMDDPVDEETSKRIEYLVKQEVEAIKTAAALSWACSRMPLSGVLQNITTRLNAGAAGLGGYINGGF